uniref:Integrase, catalytic core n=1 Tax=Tanacetum cinerariifolium TaxID=118510 RepID=A0A699GLR7_TANCI|nr:integrase, catalytic core [Tanacetum cinerariifolium]
MFDPHVFASPLEKMILFILVILVHLVRLLFLYTVFMNLSHIERLFVIHFGRLLWQKNLMHCIRLRHGDLVPLPVSKHAIRSSWVYKIKTKFEGSIERNKARLIAKGYAQEYVASSRKWKICQLDVNNVFLNGDLNEEVFMKPPPSVSHKPGEVCKLRKALYGLKQASRAWYENFATILYVDDMIIPRDDCVGIESLKLELAHRFGMKDLGLLRYFMGIEVASSPKGYLLSRSKYIGDLLNRARITYKMVEDIPIDAKAKYISIDGDPLPEPSVYQTIVGSLIWVFVSVVLLRYIVILYRYSNCAYSVFHECTKHIEIDCHFTRHHLQAGTMSLPFVPSALQFADAKTKNAAGAYDGVNNTLRVDYADVS